MPSLQNAASSEAHGNSARKEQGRTLGTLSMHWRCPFGRHPILLRSRVRRGKDWRGGLGQHWSWPGSWVCPSLQQDFRVSVVWQDFRVSMWLWPRVLWNKSWGLCWSLLREMDHNFLAVGVTGNTENSLHRFNSTLIFDNQKDLIPWGQGRLWWHGKVAGCVRELREGGCKIIIL